MNVLVGLGNPGRKYVGTRHNVGFELIAEMGRRFGADRPKSRFDAEFSEVQCAGRRLLLLAPQTFMNASGRSVRQLVDFYQIPIPSLLVACDDINLPLGRLRIRAAGSSGGQKGLQDIIRHLGTDEFARLRIGVDRPPEQMDSADYVLGRFGSRERETIERTIAQAADVVELWVTSGLPAAMNRYNAAATKDSEEDKSSGG